MYGCKLAELESVVRNFGSIDHEDKGCDFVILNPDPFYKAGEKCKLVNVDRDGRFWMEFDTERHGGFIWHVGAYDLVKFE